MTTEKTEKRRGISQLRLYKALKAELARQQLDTSMTVAQFMEIMKDEVIDEVAG